LYYSWQQSLLLLAQHLALLVIGQVLLILSNVLAVALEVLTQVATSAQVVVVVHILKH
jgi:hypothetical protein